MVMTCQPVFDAVEYLRRQVGPPGEVVLLSPQGRPFTQAVARELGVSRATLARALKRVSPTAPVTPRTYATV